MTGKTTTAAPCRSAPWELLGNGVDASAASAALAPGMAPGMGCGAGTAYGGSMYDVKGVRGDHSACETKPYGGAASLVGVHGKDSGATSGGATSGGAASCGEDTSGGASAMVKGVPCSPPSSDMTIACPSAALELLVDRIGAAGSARKLTVRADRVGCRFVGSLPLLSSSTLVVVTLLRSDC